MRLKYTLNLTLRNKEASIDQILAPVILPHNQAKKDPQPEEKREPFYRISQQP
jgi:hypothetical protein